MLKLFKRSKQLNITSPMTGKILEIENVPDEVFSQKLLGDGVAIEPADGLVVAPCDGKIIQVFPTNHAIGIETKEGLQILIHIGIDTVELKGEGFKSFVESGDIVSTGDKLLEVDIQYIKNSGKSVISPIVITNMSDTDSLGKNIGYAEAAKDLIMKIVIKK